MKASRFINKALYEERIKKGDSLRIAAFCLHISRLRLYLIEHGYLRPLKKDKPKFIEYYKLQKDFFDKKSTYISAINPVVEEATFGDELAKYYSRKQVAIGSSIMIAIALTFTVLGIVFSQKQYYNPRSAWTTNFTTFYEGVKKWGVESASLIDLDKTYKIEGTKITIPGEESTIDRIETTSTVNVYDKEYNSANTEVNSKNIVYYDKSNPKNYFNVSFDIYCYNNKKIVFSSFLNYGEQKEDEIAVNYALGLLDEQGNYTLKPFNYYVGLKQYKAEIGSKVHDRFKEIFGNYMNYTNLSFNVGILEAQKNIGHDLGYLKLNDLVNDLHTISRQYVFNFRFGVIATISGGVVTVVSFITLCLFLFSRSYLKRDKQPKMRAGEVTAFSIYDGSSKRVIRNDLALSPILPEFSLRLIGLLILFLSSFAMFATTYIIFYKNFIGFSEIEPLKRFTSTFLIAGTTLLFFIKLDIYSKKTFRDLLFNILLLFLGGLAYYLVEVTLYSALVSKKDIFSAFLTIITNVLPGNIIWNLMMYSIIFLFLFTTPKRIENNPSRILLYRLTSLIPTSILIFEFIYKALLEKNLNAPYWISFMFYTKGMFITLFAILYLYTLFFYKQYCYLKYGEKNYDIYCDSRRFAINKNTLACICIVIVVLFDLLAKYKFPDNAFGLGNNWIIVCLIPFIIFYRPHIGQRNKWVDRGYLALYGGSLAWGYIGSVLIILTLLDLSDLITILF